MVFSASSAFAVSDDATLNADDDITIEEGVLTIENDVNSPDEVSDDDVLQAAEEDDTLCDGDNVVTPENWQKFIDNETKMINYSGEELKFEGNFGPDLNIGNINVNNSIKLTGNNAVMTNISFYIMADDVVMTGFTLIEDQNGVAPIIATGVKNVEISDVKLNFTAINDYEGYAIWMNGVNNLRLLNNVISYVGTTVYNESNTNKKFAILIEGSNHALIKGNTFNVNVTSCHVDWPEIPAGSWNWVRTPYCEGIVFDSCDGLEFSENTINLGYNSRSGSDDTIYVLDVLNSDDAVISGNTITALGADHVYGIIVDNADNFTVSDNDINVSSDVHQAIGIDVEGPAAGIIKDNNISASGTLVNAVYSGMNYKPATVSIENNNITAEGYAANAVELGGTSATVEGNTIAAMGNYTATIISTVPNAVIKNNIVMSIGSNEGDAASGDYYMSKEVVAVKIISGVADISGNNISSDSFGVYAAPGTTLTLSDNEVGVISENVSSAAIFADYATLNMFNNNITYSASTVYAGENTTVINGVFVSDSKAAVKGNRFYLTVSSCHVDWPEIPAGSWNWIRTPYSEGIVFDSCDNLEFADNTISLGYNSRSGSDDTIYVLDVVNSDNVTISGNTINALGADHIYGIIVDNADNFTVCDNDINVSSDVHQAIGIDIEGPAVGTVKDNNISASGTLVNAVYSGMNYKPATVSIENNNITAEGYAANAVELGGTSATVEGNTIVAKGNYTAGIISTVPEAVIRDNVITAEGSNVGNASTGDYLMKKESVGISVAEGNATILENTIVSNGNVSVDLGNTDSIVENNKVIANNTTGDDAISSTGNATIKGNGVVKTVLVGADASGIYGNVSYSVNLTYENGTVIAGKTIVFTVDNVNFTAVTDAKGVATVNVDTIGKGNHTVVASYAGNGSDVGATTTNILAISPIASKLEYQKSMTVLITAVKKGSANYKITLKDLDGKVLAGRDVTVVFNGAKKVLTTDKNGVVNFKLSASKAASYKLTIFAADDYYVASPGTATIKINKEATKLTAKKKTFKAKVKTKKYTVTLKDSKKKAIKKAKVTLKVKGKKYTATTNAKGKATFKIKNLKKKGTYAAKVKFAGNSLYKAAKKSVKIKVKK